VQQNIFKICCTKQLFYYYYYTYKLFKFFFFYLSVEETDYYYLCKDRSYLSLPSYIKYNIRNNTQLKKAKYKKYFEKLIKKTQHFLNII